MTPNEIRTRAKNAGEHEARELYLFSLNTAEPYHKMVEPTISSLRRHAKRGDYDSDFALLSWKRVADYMAKEYCRMYCGKDQPWFSVFTIEDRCRCAVDLEDSEKETVFYELKEEKTK